MSPFTTDNESIQTETEIQDLQRKYARLVTDTIQSFQKKKVKPKKIVTHVLAYHSFPAVLEREQMKYLADESENLSGAKNLDDIFSILSKYWSFLDFMILEDIIIKFGTRNDKDELDRYYAEVKIFLEAHRVTSCIEVARTDSSSSELIYVKLDTNSLNKYYQVRGAIARLLEIEVKCLRLLRIETGCIELVMLFPQQAAQHARKLSSDHSKIKSLTADFKLIPILTVSLGEGDSRIVLFKVSIKFIL